MLPSHWTWFARQRCRISSWFKDAIRFPGIRFERSVQRLSLAAARFKYHRALFGDQSSNELWWCVHQSGTQLRCMTFSATPSAGKIQIQYGCPMRAFSSWTSIHFLKLLFPFRGHRVAGTCHSYCEAKVWYTLDRSPVCSNCTCHLSFWEAGWAGRQGRQPARASWTLNIWQWLLPHASGVSSLQRHFWADSEQWIWHVSKESQQAKESEISPSFSHTSLTAFTVSLELIFNTLHVRGVSHVRLFNIQ